MFYSRLHENEIVMEWESVVNRVAKCELGEKMSAACYYKCHL